MEKSTPTLTFPQLFSQILSINHMKKQSRETKRLSSGALGLNSLPKGWQRGRMAKSKKISRKVYKASFTFGHLICFFMLGPMELLHHLLQIDTFASDNKVRFKATLSSHSYGTLNSRILWL